MQQNAVISLNNKTDRAYSETLLNDLLNLNGVTFAVLVQLLKAHLTEIVRRLKHDFM